MNVLLQFSLQIKCHSQSVTASTGELSYESSHTKYYCPFIQATNVNERHQIQVTISFPSIYLCGHKATAIWTLSWQTGLDRTG